MLVMKFGGTSVGDGARIRAVAAIVLAHHEATPVVVTSAMAGVTDALLRSHTLAAAGDQEYAACFRALKQQHCAAALAIDPDADWSYLQQRLGELGVELATTYLNRDTSTRMRDQIAAWGELLTVVLVAGALDALGVNVQRCDRPLIVTDEHFGAATPLSRQTRALAQAAYAQMLEHDAVLVAPGFIGQTRYSTKQHKVFTTLGRGGSDYAATLLADALDADECWIYTDVDGVFTADPRVVAAAHVLPIASYAMAGRLACSGAKVLHPRAVAPAARRKIPLRVRNTFQPDHPGTLIETPAEESRGHALALAGWRDLCAVALSGQGLAEIPNLFGRMCQALTAAEAEIVLASHPVPGHDPQVLIAATDAAAAIAHLTREFAAEIEGGHVSAITTHADIALCTLVGDDLGQHRIEQAQNALACERIAPLSQSVANDALSFVIAVGELERAIRSIHHEVIELEIRETARRHVHHHAANRVTAGGRAQQRLLVSQALH